jgi:GTP-binding protein
VDKDEKTMANMEKEVRAGLRYMDYAPILFISAETGQRVHRLFELINRVYEQSNKRVTTGVLNNILSDAMARMQPPSKKGRRLRIYYITQTGTGPPNFVVFLNDPELFHYSYQRYIENRIRDTCGFEGTPVRFTVKQRGEK